MSRWRWFVLVALTVTPILVLVSFGIYSLWISGMWFWAWWPLTGSLGLAYFFGWRWQAEKKLLKVDFSGPLHLTDRDRKAWELVEERAKKAATLPANQLISFPFYADTAQAMALELAQFYHPKTKDPIGSLTIPELLAVVELAAHDLAEMVDEYLPGGHLVTINDMRGFKKLADWYPTASNITWIISGIFSPFNTAVRYFAMKAGLSRPWQMLQENMILWFYTAYVHRLGTHLIELHSGRLRIGATRYLELQKENLRAAASTSEPNLPPTAEEPLEPTVPPKSVAFAFAGQTNAGKSSLINALLGEQKALTDLLPATEDTQGFALQPPGIATPLQLLDTVGYGVKGLTSGQLRSIEKAAQQCDVMILVVHARNPARQSDLDMLKDLREYFQSHPDLRQPPILAVMTHIDLLSPAMEWAPPYDWQHPSRPKEAQIHQAIEAVREQLGSYLAGIVPVCTAPGKILGCQEWLLPALVELLDDAHAVAFLRCLKSEADEGKMRKVLQQLLASGKGLLNLTMRRFT